VIVIRRPCHEQVGGYPCMQAGEVHPLGLILIVGQAPRSQTSFEKNVAQASRL